MPFHWKENKRTYAKFSYRNKFRLDFWQKPNGIPRAYEQEYQ